MSKGQLTRDDWVEIGAAVDHYKRAIASGNLGPEFQRGEDRKWIAHLEAILETIGPDGEDMAEDRDYPALIKAVLREMETGSTEKAIDMLAGAGIPEGEEGPAAPALGSVFIVVLEGPQGTTSHVFSTEEKADQWLFDHVKSKWNVEESDGSPATIPEDDPWRAIELYFDYNDQNEWHTSEIIRIDGEVGASPQRAPVVNACPICGTDEITGGPVEIEGDNAIQVMSCLACGTRWHDVYGLVNNVIDEEGEAGK